MEGKDRWEKKGSLSEFRQRYALRIMSKSRCFQPYPSKNKTRQ